MRRRQTLTTLAIAVLISALALACAAANDDAASDDPAGDQPTSSLPTEPGSVITDAVGTIQKVGEEWYGIVPDLDPGTRYAPDELPAELRQDGVRVVFSGVLGENERNVRRWGTPLELTAIRRLQE